MAFRSLEHWMERQEESITKLHAQQTEFCQKLQVWMEEESLTKLHAQQAELCQKLQIWMEENSGRQLPSLQRAETLASSDGRRAPAAWGNDDNWSQPPAAAWGSDRAAMASSRPGGGKVSDTTVVSPLSRGGSPSVPPSAAAAGRISATLARKTVREGPRSSLRPSNYMLADESLTLLDTEESGCQQRWRQKIQTFVASSYFESTFACVVLLNFLWIGVSMETRNFLGDESHKVEVIFLNVDLAFCVTFLIELLCRLGGSGLAEFFCSEKDWAWNWFDVIIVCLTTFEVAISLHYGLAAGGLEGVSSLRVVRVMRVLRVVRVIRGMRNFRPLRLLILAIANTIRSAMWTLLLLLMIIYTFSVMFAQSTVEYLSMRNDLPEDDLLRLNFGTLGKTLFTLFSASTGGCDWQDVAAPLMRVHWGLMAGFIVYISFQYFCVMNVVTGIFCQSALEIAKNDREDMIAQQLLDKEKYVAALQELFTEWDASGTGEITLEQFQHYMKDSRMQAFLRTLEIEPYNALTLFKLLDADGQGTLDVGEFVGGLIELRGNAKSIQIHELLHESTHARENLQRMFDYLVAVEEEKIEREAREQFDDSGTGSTTDTVGTPPSGRENGQAAPQSKNPLPPSPTGYAAYAAPPPEPPHVVSIDMAIDEV